MVSIENSSHQKGLLQVLEFSFGKVFLFDMVIVSEIKENIAFGVEEAKQVVDRAVAYYKEIGAEKKRVYIANRVHKYSVKPVGWLKFGHLDEYLYGYCVIDNSRYGFMNALLESKFVPITFKAVTSLDEALEWAAMITVKKEQEVLKSQA